MKPRYILALTSLALLTSLHAVDLSDQEIEALRDWINTKRLVTVKELGGQLSISGDVHAELQSATEVKNGQTQRGPGTGTPTNSYDVEFNVNIDYRTENTWSSARIRFDNDAGTTNEFFGSGTNNKIKVDRAYFGYRVIDQDRHTMEVELGRRPNIFVVFDSKMQFFSNFDGVNFKDSYALENVGDLYYQVGAFLVSEKKNQAAYVGEIGLQNIAGTGFYTKYSLVDWDTKDLEKIPQQFHFIISQLILGYKFLPVILDKIVIVYTGGLYNHRARPLEVSANKKANFGGYLGFTVGQLKMAGDWSLEANYQVLAAQCVPDFDVSGVGLGNNAGNGFYFQKTETVEKCGCKNKPTPSTRKNAEGNVNFRGFKINLQYLLTNNLNILQEWQQSITLDKEIGPFRRFKQYEIDFVYLF
jgi:hypothetical protein